MRYKLPWTSCLRDTIDPRMELNAMLHIFCSNARHRLVTTRICFWGTVSILFMICSAACAPTLAPTPHLTPSGNATGSAVTVPTTASLPNDWSSHWLRGIPCTPPCWEGITPGHSTAHEALTLLQANPLIANASLEISRADPDFGEVVWRWADGQPGGTARFHAQTSNQIIYSIPL